MPVPEIKTYQTISGNPIHQIPIEAFPGLWTYAYLVIHEDLRVLIDAGSSFSSSTDQLLSGIKEIGMQSDGNGVAIDGLTHIFITHGHIDHFGGLLALRPQTTAAVGIHELDRRNLTHFLERRTLNMKILADYLVEAGVGDSQREDMLEFYRYLKDLFEPTNIDFTYESLDMQLGPFEFLHVPGHSGGHVVIRLEDVLFCGDHILSDITPHQAPEQLSTWGGLNHYLSSLDLVERWGEGTNLALCGHRRNITDLSQRISEIKKMHADRLVRVLDFFKSPNTIFNLTKNLFGEVNGFNALLALEEAGAHVEYLYQRGLLTIVNYEEVGDNSHPYVHYYQSQ